MRMRILVDMYAYAYVCMYVYMCTMEALTPVLKCTQHTLHAHRAHRIVKWGQGPSSNLKIVEVQINFLIRHKKRFLDCDEFTRVVSIHHYVLPHPPFL